MKRDVLVTAVEGHISQANGNVAEGQRTFHQQMDEVIATEGITLQDVSLKNLFEALVDRDRSIDLTNSVDVAESMYAAGMPGLVGKLLHPAFIESYDAITQNVLPLVTEVNSSKSSEEIGGMSAHDMPGLVREGSPYEASQPLEKVIKINNHKYGITIDLSVEAITEDRTGQIVARAKEIGIKGATQIHALIVEKVCDLASSVTGEAANKSLYINGSYRDMYSADHSAWDVQTNPNLADKIPSTNTLFNDVLELFAAIKDEKGDPILIMPKFIVCAPALETQLRTLIGSVNSAGTGNNDINIFKDAYKVISSPFITTATQWWIGDFARQSRLQWYWKPKTDTLANSTQAAFDRDIVSQYKYSYFCGVGCTDYRYAAQGDS